MLSLSSSILSSYNSLDQSTKKLKSTIKSYMTELGVYGDDIYSLILQIESVLEKNNVALLELSKKALQNYEFIIQEINRTSSQGKCEISNKFNGSADIIRTGNSTDTFQVSHKSLLTSKDDRIKGIINDIQAGRGELISQDKASQIHESLRDFSGSFYTDIRSAYNNPNAEQFFESQMKLLDEYINKSPKWKGTIFRGINVDSVTAGSILRGETIDMLGPSSWSSSEHVAEEFASGKYLDQPNDTFIVFVLENNKSGVSITHLSTYNGIEEEVLAPSGVQYIKDNVTFKEIDGKKYLCVYVHERSNLV